MSFKVLKHLISWNSLGNPKAVTMGKDSWSGATRAFQAYYGRNSGSAMAKQNSSSTSSLNLWLIRQQLGQPRLMLH